MEYWKYKADDGLILQTDPCHPYKNRSHSAKPSIPALQYSIIPLPLAAESRHSRLALTWPRGPGLLRRNKILAVSATISTLKKIAEYRIDPIFIKNDRDIYDRQIYQMNECTKFHR